MIIRLPLTLLALLQATLLTQTATALVVGSIHMNQLLPRDTCAGQDDFRACGQDLPDNFCCPSDGYCTPIYNTGIESVAICCPTGKDCSTITVITCDASFQDPSVYPRTPVHSSDTSKELPKCGNGCCPYGYECVELESGGNQCTIKEESKRAPVLPSESSASSSTTSSTSSTASSTSTSSSLSTSSVSSDPSATSSPQSDEPRRSDKTNEAGLVLAGLFPGLIIGAAIVAGVLFYLKKRRAKRSFKSDGSSSFFGPPTPQTSLPAPKISEPIYHPGMAERVMFTHNRSASGSTMLDNGIPIGGAGYYKPNINRSPTDSATLVSPPPKSSSAKKVRALDPPFETPTKPAKGASRSMFSRPRSSRSSRRDTQASTETISIFQGTPVPFKTPEMRKTTYSDVYRAAGISPSKVQSTRPSEDMPRR